MLVITLSDQGFSQALTMQTHCCMVPGKWISDVCSASKTKLCVLYLHVPDIFSLQLIYCVHFTGSPSKKESCSKFFCLYINFSNGNHQVIFLKISPCTTQMDLEVAGGSALLLTSPSWLFHVPKGRPGTVHSLLLPLNCETSCRCHQGSGIHCHL